MITLLRRWFAVACVLATNHDLEVEHAQHRIRELEDTQNRQQVRHTNELGDVAHKLAIEKAEHSHTRRERDTARQTLSDYLDQAVR